MTLDPQQITVIALLFAIGAAGLAKKWVFGWTYSEMERDRNFWRDIALKGISVTGKAVAVAEKQAESG